MPQKRHPASCYQYQKVIVTDGYTGTSDDWDGDGEGGVEVIVILADLMGPASLERAARMSISCDSASRNPF